MSVILTHRPDDLPLIVVEFMLLRLRTCFRAALQICVATSRPICFDRVKSRADLFSIAGDSVRIVSAITAMLIGLASPLGQGGTAIAAEINILSSNGLKEVLQDLAPEFSRTTGHKLSMVFDSSAGAKRRIEGGEAFDVALVTPPMIADLVKQGKIVAGTSADIARTGLGVASVRGAELLGPLPSELQTFVVLTSGIAAGTKEAAPARELIKFLAAPDAAQVMKAHGMESLAR